MTRDFRFMVLTLPGSLDPSLAIAASRAGELGVLDLEYASDEESAIQAAVRLAEHARGECGLKLSCQQGKLLSRLLARTLEPVSFVVLTGRNAQALRQQVEAVRRMGWRIFLEAFDLAGARLGEDLGVDALIAKGNEAGGFVGEETTFVLLQKLLTRLSLPVYAQGGIGLHTAAACYAAGAAGVVLDAQVSLARESRLPAEVQERIAAMDGSETICLGGEWGALCRFYFRPGMRAGEELYRVEEELSEAPLSIEEKKATWRDVVRSRVGWMDPNCQTLLLGQDAAFAAALARRFVTVSGILSAMRESIRSHCELASQLRPLDQGAPLARSHGTRYPIVQGPMTRVSDNAAFALEVAKGGGLPFLALAVMRRAEVSSLLEETRRTLGELPWGVGILGFVPPELRQEQLEAIRMARPQFALIAGGRPDQASLLEREGIPTYLHVPSPDLLKMFLAEGAQRFVFEGRECGGHVGPRSSFVLWELMVDVLLEHLTSTKANAEGFHVLFAGGIHDALSSSMVAVLAAPLAALGVRVGVLMGTAYLFTREVVATGAITPRYQVEALRAAGTVLLETGPGHVTRCLPTPYTQVFVEHRRHLLHSGVTGERLREELEALNLGRLRIASKGIARHPDFGRDPSAPKYVTYEEDEQYEQGMYMVGQVVALRDEVCTIEALHRDVSIRGSARLAALAAEMARRPEPLEVWGQAEPSRIAIIGMACILPGATHLQAYWENILNRVDAITEIPLDRFDWRRYFDPDRNARDKIYSKWGGFIGEVPFNPLDYGMPPSSVSSIEPMQLLMLEVARAALADAGYLQRPFPRERTSVIMAAGGGLGDLGYHYGFRSYLPHFFDEASQEVIERLSGVLPEWTEDSFPGILLNVLAGRVANRFDLGGPNFTVDAACASSLAALDVAMKDLEARRTDMAIVGAADTVQSPFAFLAFSKTQALSPSGRCRPFDANADGIAISEGVAVVILKRLDDAERDGDRIYAVIQGIGASSDGRDRSLTAPRAAGQLRALRRAYAKAGFSPATVGLIEAHGTGTKLGDAVEGEALATLFREAQAGPQVCAIGSVKSMIGHTKSTAGLASLIKVAMALYHKVLPPTLVDQVNPQISKGDSPLYVNREPRPWLITSEGCIRRAGVSAFGFGGTNFHIALEEYRSPYPSYELGLQTWPAELLLLRGVDREGLLSEVNALHDWLVEGNIPPLRDLAYTLYRRSRQRLEASEGAKPWTLAIVATSLEDLQHKLARAKAAITAGEAQIWDAQGIYLTGEPFGREGKLVFLFPGQGSQYPNMLRDLAVLFPQVRRWFEEANLTLADRLPKPLSEYIFPVPAEDEKIVQAQRQALMDTQIAQPALGAAGLAISGLLQAMHVRPDFVAGHSYGELVALCQAGVFGARELFLLSEARGRFMAEATGPDAGAMAAVRADRPTVEEVTREITGVILANLNSPCQTVISGPTAAVEETVRRLKAQGVAAQLLPVACAFHSPLVESASSQLAQFLKDISFRAPQLAVFSNTTAALYPEDPEQIRAILCVHLARPVEFQREIEAMYQAGARIFVEVGPRHVLTGLVGQILAGRSYLAVPIDDGGPGLLALLRALGQLAAAGLDVRLEPLFEGRPVSQLNLSRPYEDPEQARYGPTTWLVSGGRARPWGEAQKGPPGRAMEPLRVRLLEPGSSASPPPNQLMAGVPPPLEAREATSAQKTRSAIQTPSADVPQPERSIPADEAAQVMLQHQRLMERFLEAQRNIMLAYLGDHGTRACPVPHAQTDGVRVTPAAHRTSEEAVTGEPERLRPSSADEGTRSDDERSVLSYQPLDELALTRELLALVSERTGYPQEMLSLEVNLEADLGIDSIKRVEILGALRSRHPLLQRVLAGPSMEQLQSQHTLRGIVDRILALMEPSADAMALASEPLATRSREVTDGGSGLTAAMPAASVLARLASARSPVQRYRVVPSPIAPPDSFTPLAPGRVILITDDGGGVARTVAEMLQQQGHRVAVVAFAPEGAAASRERASAGRFYMADLAEEGATRALVHAVHQEQGAIGSLLHLAPLRGWSALEAMDWQDWQHALSRDLISLFHLLQALHDDLATAAQAGGSCLLAATPMGGAFASGDGSDVAFFPGHGGLAGFLKTAAHELPAVQVKVVDLDRSLDVQAMAQVILHEAMAGDRVVEVSYRAGQRWTLTLVPAPVDGVSLNGLVLNEASVILITGGARGITALAAQELARRYRPTLILVGRSPMPPAEESPQTAGLTSPRELKAALMQSLDGHGHRVPLAEVEAAYQRLLREREMRANLAALHQSGATVEYHAVDVRDEAAFGQLIDDLYRRFGRLDGVIHGAGLVEDRLIRDKTSDSFRRVLSTKADSAFTLSRKLRPETLQFLAFFSSVSGRFGNRGQGDYAAANEILNKLAVYLDRRWPARVVSINWGPWDGPGMVTPELRQEFARRGVSLISAEVGLQRLVEEILYGRKGEAEVLICGEDAQGMAKPSGEVSRV